MKPSADDLRLSSLTLGKENLKKSENSCIIYIESERESNLSQNQKTKLVLTTECERRRTTMTNREFYTSIMNTESLSAEVREHAEAALNKLDATNEKRKSATSKKALENQPLIDRIINEILDSQPKTASDVAAVLEVSVQKASMLCRAAVEQGHAKSQDIKVPKKGVQKGYTLLDDGD